MSCDRSTDTCPRSRQRMWHKRPGYDRRTIPKCSLINIQFERAFMPYESRHRTAFLSAAYLQPCKDFLPASEPPDPLHRPMSVTRDFHSTKSGLDPMVPEHRVTQRRADANSEQRPIATERGPVLQVMCPIGQLHRQECVMRSRQGERIC